MIESQTDPAEVRQAAGLLWIFGDVVAEDDAQTWPEALRIARHLDKVAVSTLCCLSTLLTKACAANGIAVSITTET